MKKLVSFVLAVMVFAAALPFAVSAEGIGESVPTKFSYIAVQDGLATVKTEDGSTLVSFPGYYPDDCLTPDEEIGWDPAALYDGPELCYNGTLKLTGRGGALNNMTFTWTCDGTNVSLSLTVPLIGTNTRTAPACDFDKFLWEKGWYLSSVSRNHNISLTDTSDTYVFRVMDAATNQPVRNEEGKCLYYQVAYLTDNVLSLDYRATEIDFVTGGWAATQFYMSLKPARTYLIDHTATITSAYGEENRAPRSAQFQTPVTDKNGNSFSGDWYFFQWMVAKARLQTNTGFYSITRPIGTDTYAPYNKYTPKEGVKADIAYVLEGEDEVLVYNSDDELLFPFEGDTESVMEMLQTEGGCGFNTVEEVIDEESGKTYNKWSYVAQTSPLGDINLDGAVTADDITVLAREIAGIEKNPAVGYVLSDDGDFYALGDVNFDNAVNADDITALARAVAGIEALSAVGTTYSGVYAG